MPRGQAASVEKESERDPARGRGSRSSRVVREPRRHELGDPCQRAKVLEFQLVHRHAHPQFCFERAEQLDQPQAVERPGFEEIELRRGRLELKLFDEEAGDAPFEISKRPGHPVRRRVIVSEGEPPLAIEERQQSVTLLDRVQDLEPS